MSNATKWIESSWDENYKGAAQSVLEHEDPLFAELAVLGLLLLQDRKPEDFQAISLLLKKGATREAVELIDATRWRAPAAEELGATGPEMRAELERVLRDSEVLILHLLQQGGERVPVIPGIPFDGIEDAVSEYVAYLAVLHAGVGGYSNVFWEAKNAGPLWLEWHRLWDLGKGTLKSVCPTYESLLALIDKDPHWYVWVQNLTDEFVDLYAGAMGGESEAFQLS